PPHVTASMLCWSNAIFLEEPAMGGIDRDLHWPWLGFALEQAFERGLYDAKDVLAHATAEVLVSQLPHEVIIALFSRALASESLTPRHVLETAPPSMLAEH